MISTTGRMPDQAHAEGDAEEPVLADRRVADALEPVLLGQPDVGLEHAAVGADVLAHEQDRVVRRHRVVERGVDRLAVGQLGRAVPVAAGAASVSVDIGSRLLEGRVGGTGRALGGGVDLGLDLGPDLAGVVRSDDRRRRRAARRGARSGRAPSSVRARPPAGTSPGRSGSGRGSGTSSSRAGSAPRRGAPARRPRPSPRGRRRCPGRRR